MLDLRIRTIAIKVNGEWYSISFKPKFLGRIKDITVRKSAENKPNGVFGWCDAEISHQDISTVEVLKCVRWEIKEDVTRFLRKIRRKKSSGKSHRQDQM
ncbi:MAG: hypothetical protein HFF84_16110 [Oscillibacter sp.]|nr:hypothetical protein [Oscillibacter sp.]